MYTATRTCNEEVAKWIADLHNSDICMRNPNQPGCALHTETSLFLPQDANAERKKAGDLDSARTASARHLNATTDYSLSHDDDEREAEGANLAGINPGLFSYSTLKRATRARSLSAAVPFFLLFFSCSRTLVLGDGCCCERVNYLLAVDSIFI